MSRNKATSREMEPVKAECFLGSDVRGKFNAEEINKTNSRASNSHVTKLINMSSIICDDKKNERTKLRELVQNTFKELNKIETLELLLKVIATIDNLKISFDFNEVPDEQLKTRQDEREINIRAIGLHDDKTRYEIYGRMSHEFCHIAMNRIFENNYKPYYRHFEPNYEFEHIVQSYEGQSYSLNSEPIICALSHTMSMRYGEIIAQVPQLIALYNKNIDELEYFKTRHKQIYEFYKHDVLEELSREIPILEAIQTVQDFNKSLGFASELKEKLHLLEEETLRINFNRNCINEISSKDPQLTVLAIYQQNHMNKFFDSFLIFADMESLKKTEIFTLLVESLTVCIKPTVIINCNSSNKSEVSGLIQQFHTHNIKQVVLVHSLESVADKESYHISFLNKSRKKHKN